MGKKLAFIILACSFVSIAGSSQPVLFINAGSRASYGTNQELTIGSKGNCRYYLREVNGPLKDSSVFSISQQQLDSILNRADQLNFFNLDEKYDGGRTDGAGIYISINRSGRKHSVHMTNTDQPVIRELVTLLNSILTPQKIRINYGQFVTK
jgi:hypothetical protein